MISKLLWKFCEYTKGPTVYVLEKNCLFMWQTMLQKGKTVRETGMKKRSSRNFFSDVIPRHCFRSCSALVKLGKQQVLSSAPSIHMADSGFCVHGSSWTSPSWWQAFEGASKWMEELFSCTLCQQINHFLNMI